MKLKALFLGVALAIGGSAFMAPPAQASGIPVIDVANLQQTIMQYLNMIQQLKQLEAQLTQAKEQFESITGGRGLGGILTENYTSKLPTNWQETLAGMDGGGTIGGLATSIYDSASLLESGNFEHLAGDVLDGLKDNMASAANGQALNAQTFDGSAARFDRIQGLMQQINSAGDLKAIEDLNARIAAENAMLTNELIKLQSMNALLDNQREVALQKRTQELMEMSSHKYGE